jgi:hypothetical protein
MPRLSRRAFVTAVGGGALALASASLAWRRRWPWTRFRPLADQEGAVETYIDRDGWVLTPADTRKMSMTPPPTPGAP